MITGVVLARNEEHNIVDCLAALRPHVAELLLIDMESSDRTVELAEPHVDRVLRHPLVANFDAARNIAIEAARYDWLWFVDADERIPAETGRVVQRFLREHGHEFEALSIPFKSYFAGKWIQHCGWWPGYTMPRVLKRGHFRFSERLHGGVECNGREARLPPDPKLGVDHYSYRSIEHYLEKLNRYTSTEAAQMAAAGRRWDWRAATAHMVHDLWTYYEVNRGGLDGEHGWILSWLSAQYRWLQHAKLLDLTGTQPLEHGSANIPASLDDVLLFMQEELAALRARQPHLPLGIVWRSPLWDYSGYADESRALVKALSAGERDLAAEEIRWSDRVCPLSPPDQRFLRALTDRRRAGSTIAITNCIPSLVEPDRCAALNVLRTTFETDRIPQEWLPRLSKFDEIWVTSRHAERSFRRSGIAPERLRVVPSCVDTELFRPEGPTCPRPLRLQNRFLFLSVLEWQLRKGWDVLLRAYVRAYPPSEPVALVLKCSYHHGQCRDTVVRQIDALLGSLGTSLAERSDILFLDDVFASEDMAALYRAANAFVLASRAEGWGRPYLEAIACGIPVIATKTSGQLDFLSEDNCVFVGGREAEVSEEAARELPLYCGHRWFEPDEAELVQAMRRMVDQAPLRERLVHHGLAAIKERFDLSAGLRTLEQAIKSAEGRFFPPAPLRSPDDAIRLELEGELFAGHSFSNINEQLAVRFASDRSLSLSITRKFYNPTYDHDAVDERLLLGYVGRELDGGADIVIRHAFPPNFAPPAQGKWVHIQPWEFGHLPKAWIEPLRDRVDEIWAPSHYVKRVYERSGIPSNKIQVIPWGIDERVFSPDAPPLHLPTSKRFKFLFMGGTIPRKGFDQLLEAYCAEFTREDDVCLVVKDVGTTTFYRYGNSRDRVRECQADHRLPEILYLDTPMTAGQRASLYAACDCLAAPYRGEGFGLPVLEGMACGLPVVVPQGGPTDDFVTSESGWALNAVEQPTQHDWPLTGPAVELAIDPAELRVTLRGAYTEIDEVRRRGIAAARQAERFTWDCTVALMRQRIESLARGWCGSVAPELASTSIAAIVEVKNESRLPGHLARVRPLADVVHVWGTRLSPRVLAVAAEYGAAVFRDYSSALEACSSVDWYFATTTNDSWREIASPQELKNVLRNQVPQVHEVNVELSGSGVHPTGNCGLLSLRRKLASKTHSGDQSRIASAVFLSDASGGNLRHPCR